MTDKNKLMSRFHLAFYLLLAGSVMSKMVVPHEFKATAHLAGEGMVIITGLFLLFSRVRMIGLSLSPDEKLAVLYTAVTVASKIILLIPEIDDYGFPFFFLFYYLAISSYVKLACAHDDSVFRLCVIFGVISYLLAIAGVVMGREQFGRMIFGPEKWGYFGDKAFLLMGFSHNPNWLAFDLMVGVLSFLAIAFRSLSERRYMLSLLCVGLVVPLCVYIGVLGTRTVMLCIALYVMMTATIYFRRLVPVSRKVHIAVLIFTVGCVMFFVYSGLYQHLLPKMDKGMSTRDILWAKVLVHQKYAFPSMQTFFGWGTWLMANYVAPHREHLHNLVLHLWTLNGVFSLLSMLVFLGYIVVRSFRVGLWYFAFIPISILARESMEATIGVKIFHCGVAFLFVVWMLACERGIGKTDPDR